MRKKKSKTLILYDGSNFYHSLKKLGIKHTLSFDYTTFHEWITEGRSCVAKYFIGEIRYNPSDQQSKRLFSGQRRLFTVLTRHKIQIEKGYMLKTDGVYHEKGVDVQIALDIAIGAYENTYDTCYLISSDTDLIPAIHKAKSLGKKIVYVGFGKHISQAMKHNCSATRILTKLELAQFVK